MTAIAPVPPITIGAFCENAHTQALLAQAAADPRMARAQMQVETGGVSAAFDKLSAAPTPDLLMVESSAERDVLLARLDALAEVCDPACKLVAIGDVNDIVLYRELMARGVSEYVVHPFTSSDLVRLVAGLYVHPSQRLVGRVIAVTGAKGGVGTSTIAHHLAASMARNLRQQVILVDMDIGFGTAGLNFNQEPATTLADAMEASERVDTYFVERLLVRCEDNLGLLAAPALVEAAHDAAADVFDPVLDAARAIAPFIVLDLPHGWPDWKKRALLSADEVVIVAEPDLANLRNTKNLFDFLRHQRPNDLHPRLVLNRVGLPKRPEIGIVDFEKALAEAPAVVLAQDARLFCTAANNGQLALDLDGAARFAQAMRHLSFMLASRGEVETSRSSRLAPFLGRLRSAFG